MARREAADVVRSLVGGHNEVMRLAAILDEAHEEIAMDTVALLGLWKPGETKYFDVSGSRFSVTRRGDDLDVRAITVLYPFELVWPGSEADAAALPPGQDAVSADFVEVGFPHPDSAEAAEFGREYRSDEGMARAAGKEVAIAGMARAYRNDTPAGNAGRIGNAPTPFAAIDSEVS